MYLSHLSFVQDAVKVRLVLNGPFAIVPLFEREPELHFEEISTFGSSKRSRSRNPAAMKKVPKSFRRCKAVKTVSLSSS